MRRPNFHERLVSADSPERSRCFVLVEEYLNRSECFVEYRYLGGCANAGTDWVVRCLGRFIRGRWRAVSVASGGVERLAGTGSLTVELGDFSLSNPKPHAFRQLIESSG